MSNEHGFMLHDYMDNLWVLQTINGIKPITTNGLEYFSQITLRFLRECGSDREDYPALFEQYDFFIEKVKSRIERYSDLSEELDAFTKMFREKTGVVITSCHKIKGEEYDTVMSYGILQGMIPHWSTIYGRTPNVSELDEARRMLYVIASRAKKSLYLFAEQGRTTRGGYPYALTEILQEYDYDYDTL